MEQQPWETRSGEQLPDMSPKQGEDLAAMQRRQSNHRRDRASIEQQRHQDAAKQRAKLEERAQDHRVREFLASRPVKIAVGALVGLLLFWLLAWPRIDAVLNPSANYGDLQSTLPQINLAASKELGGEAAPSIKSQDTQWIVSYKLSRGTLLFNGRKASSSCGVGFSVDKDQPSQSPLKWQQIFSRRCS